MRLFIIYYLCSQQITDAEVEQYSKALEVQNLFRICRFASHAWLKIFSVLPTGSYLDKADQRLTTKMNKTKKEKLLSIYQVNIRCQALDKRVWETKFHAFLGNRLRHVGPPISETVEDCDQNECGLNNRLQRRWHQNCQHVQVISSSISKRISSPISSEEVWVRKKDQFLLLEM